MVKQFLALIVCALSLAACGNGGVSGFVVSSSVSGSQPVGLTSTWIASGGGSSMAYRFNAARTGGPLRVIYDFTPEGIFEWTPIDEGHYIITLDARNNMDGTIESKVFEILVEPIATTEPIVFPTTNPLVALFGVPPCEDGSSVRVLFRPVGATDFDSTDTKECVSGRSTNFYIAGMTEDTAYEMFHEVLNPARTTRVIGSQVLFYTGIIPAEATFPTTTIVSPLTVSSSIVDDIILHTTIRGTPGDPAIPFATNLNGDVVWYVEKLVQQAQSALTRPLAGGGVLVQNGSKLQEFDLGGNIVQQTTIERINEQLLAVGEDPIIGTHHELRRLPNGHTVTIGYVERLFLDVQGTGIIDILADMIIVLDENFQLAWVWNAFDHMDVSRAAILGQTCRGGEGGCPPSLNLADVANDWTHSNAVGYSPGDGNLILSVRHQDWVIKIDYRDGSGTGDIIWRLGEDGDFTLASMDASPWFSHQHDSNYISNNHIVLYDNGNTRVANSGSGNSRGQVYLLDETTLSASLVLNADLGVYSLALGSAQVLSNGNYHFNSGLIDPQNVYAIGDEVLPDGTLDYGLQIDRAVYRSFRMPDMYTPPLGTN